MKILLLDVDDTLLDFKKCAASSMKAAFAAHGLTYREKMFPVFLSVNTVLWQEIERGTLTKSGLYERRFATIFDRLGLKGDARGVENDFRKNLAVLAEPIDGARETVAYLAGKYTLAVASNASKEQQIKRLTKAGLYSYFRYIFVSEEMGAEKPSSAFFDACFSRLPPVDRRDVMLIGDSLTADIAGGIGYGIRTCWYNPDGLPVPAGISPDHTVRTLKELCDIL